MSDILVRVFVFVCLLVVTQTRELGGDSRTLQQRLEHLERLVVKQNGRISTLENEVSNQRKLLKSANEELNNYRARYLNDSDQHIRNLRAPGSPSPKVAFSAYLDHVIKHVGIDSIVPFNQVILNDGGAYNPVTGIFTVPVTGVYLFTYSVNTYVEAYQLVVKLVLDNVNMSDGTSDPFNERQEIQGGNTVMFKAKQGQSVWLAAYNTGDTIVDGREDYRFSTLSGVLLYTS